MQKLPSPAFPLQVLGWKSPSGGKNKIKRHLPGADEGGPEGSTCIASGRRPVLVRFWQGLGARDCGGYV